MGNWFANPGMLYLSLGALAPVIIHLLRRRRLIEVHFPAVRFLRTSTKRASTRTNLKHLLLLLLRMAVIVLLAALLARPRPIGGARLVEGQGGQAAACVVLIVDDSLSMNYRPSDAAWFEQARSGAIEVLDRLPVDGEVAVMTTGRPAVRFVTDRDEALGLLMSLRATQTGSSCWPALLQAAGALEARPVSARAVVLLTDMTRSAWADIASRKAAPLELGPEVTLDIVAVGKENAANLAVTAVRHGGKPIVEGAVLDLRADLLCVGRARADSVQFEFDGRVISRRPVSLEPGETLSAAMRAPIESRGHHWGRVSLLNADALPQDDARTFAVEAKGRLNVLCVDAGAGQGWDAASAFYAAALSPWEGERRGVWGVQTIPPEDLHRQPLGEVDLVALIDTPAPSPGAWGRLADFVAGGGGLLLTTGEGLDIAGYAAPQAARLLPALPADVHRPPTTEGAAPQSMLLRAIRPGHPLAKALADAGADLGRVSWYTCRRLKTAPEAEELFSFGPGLPALALGRLGAGRTAVFGGDMAGRWSNFPREPEFVPFCHEIGLYLTGASVGRLSAFEVGEHVPVRFQPAAAATTVAVTPPGEEQSSLLMPGATPGRRVFWRTDRPGYYRVDFSRGEEKWQGGFGINTAPGESDLRLVKGDDVRQAIKAARVAVLRDTSGVRLGLEGGAGGGSGFDPTALVALLALAACAGELLLANRIYRPNPE